MLPPLTAFNQTGIRVVILHLTRRKTSLYISPSLSPRVARCNEFQSSACARVFFDVRAKSAEVIGVTRARSFLLARFILPRVPAMLAVTNSVGCNESCAGVAEQEHALFNDYEMRR